MIFKNAEQGAHPRYMIPVRFMGRTVSPAVIFIKVKRLSGRDRGDEVGVFCFL